MPDVAKKVISANPVKNGSAVVGVDRTGNKQSLPPAKNEATDVTQLDTRYTNRFDDPLYYSA